MTHPDESGTFKVGRIYGAQLCLQISNEDVERGDYIEFYRRGQRCRRVKDVHRGRKHNYVQFEPCLVNPFKNQKINLKDIRSVWRPQPELVLWKDPNHG